MKRSELASSPLHDEDDDALGGGFYGECVESFAEFNLDLDRSQPGTTEQFVDTKSLTSSHVLSHPSEGQSLVCLAHDQLEQGEKLKFIESQKAAEHFRLAASLFRQAAEAVGDEVTSASLQFLAENAGIMTSLIEECKAKQMPKSVDEVSSDKHNDSVNALSEPNSSEMNKALQTVLNDPHHYDKVYTVLPMSSSRSFFGEFQSQPVSFGESSRISLQQSRERVKGINRIPKMDMTLSSSSLSTSFMGQSLKTSSIPKSVQKFLRDLRRLEHRLASMGLMQPNSEEAASMREEEKLTSESSLSQSAARLSTLSSQLDESFMYLSHQESSDKAHSATERQNLPNPYGTHNRDTGSKAGYWNAGLGLLEMASKLTGISSPVSPNEETRKPQDIEPATAKSKESKTSTDVDESVSESFKLPTTANKKVEWNDSSMMLHQSAVSFSPDQSKGLFGIDEDDRQREILSTQMKYSTHPAGEGPAGVLRLLSTIERLSDENARLEETVESLKRAQHKNSLLTAQIDQFKIEYKLKIDQMKSEVFKMTSENKSDEVNNGQRDAIKQDTSFHDPRDKKINELERAMNALLKKMTEMKHDSDRKDDAIRYLKAKREKKDKEKKNKEKDSESTKAKPPIHGSNDGSGSGELSLSSRRGIAAKNISISTSSPPAQGVVGSHFGNSGNDNGTKQKGISTRSHDQSRTKPSQSTATSTLQNSLKRELSATSSSTSKNQSSSLRKGHQNLQQQTRL